MRPLHHLTIFAVVTLFFPRIEGTETTTIALNTGKQIYRAACSACHGPDGKGTPVAIAGFKRPDSFPDFTRCDQTTPEDNLAWKSVITDGGPSRGFSSIMPSFRDALTPEQIDKVVHHLRSFCTAQGWPRGELNVPRALITEKAFPEDELVLTTTLNASGAPGVTNQIVDEQRFGVKNQLEVTVPIDFTDQNHVWYGGFGDAELAIKREIFSNLQSGSILSVQGGALFASGSRTHGFGAGTTTFESFAAFDQLFPALTFIQLQAGTDLPVNTHIAPQSVFWRAALGKSFAQNEGLGRLWSPMVEWLATRDLVNHAVTDWDILPQLEVTLSKRQHIQASAGVDLPLTNTAGRSPTVLFFVLWDWQDGKLTEGW